jgi:Na+/proline symporter
MLRQAPREPTQQDPVSAPRLLAALGCGAFVLAAVVVEVLSGQAANTPTTARHAAFVPLAWPAPLRVAWWLLVAGAAVAHRRLLQASSSRRERVLTTVVAVPFVCFAVGVALGADWATWH